MLPTERANEDASATESRRTRLEKPNINLAREENKFLVAPPGTTGVDWWPYTWDGAQGFATPTTVQPAPTPAQLQQPETTSTTASPASSTVSSTMPTLSRNPAPETTSTTTSPASSSIVSSTTPTLSLKSAPSIPASVLSTTSTASGTSAASVRAVSAGSPFKLYLLAPFIGGVGLALLVICIVCRRRRRRRHNDSVSAFEAGPRYETNESKSLFPADGMQQVSLLRPHDLRYPQRANANLWPSSHRSGRSKRSSREAAPSGLSATSRFLHTLGVPELSEHPDSPSVYSMPSRGTSRAMTVLSAHPKNAGADESYESRHPRSTQHGLAAHIHSEIQGGAGYRAVSDEEDEEEDEMLAYYESGRLPLSAVTARSGPGFSIVQEEPPSPSALNSDPNSSWLAWTRGWSASNVNLAEQGPPPSGQSHFTPKPVRRRDKTSASSSGAVTPTARTPTHSRPPSHPTTPVRSRPSSRAMAPAPTQPPRAAMLPASPPLVCSPQLNAALTFGGADPGAYTTPPPQPKSRAPSPCSRDTTHKHHHLRTTRQVRLPYPGDETDTEHGRGREQRKKSLPPPLVEKQVSDVSETTLRGTSPEREGALCKVDAIVARSLVQKRVASEESELAGWTSIQQRLEMLG